MNKRVIIILLVVLIGGAVIYGLTANNKNDKTTQNNAGNTGNTSQQNNQPKSGQNSQAQTNPSSTGSVAIQNFAFAPGDITIKKGTTVTWTNNDSTTHTVTETDSQTGPKSGDLKPGDKYTFTFSSAGTFYYHCSIHPTMLGTVTVTE